MKKHWAKIFVYPILAVFIFVLSIVFYFFISMPNISKLNTCFETNMFHVQFCKKSANYTPLPQIPKHMIQCLLLSEDANFYNHHGFDFDEMSKSFETNWKNRTYSRGGSTISQQLIKNAFLSQDKTLWRKLREFYLTYQLEKRYTKSQILEAYLNMVEFGKGIYGIKPAAQFYFKTTPSQLTAVQSCYLVQLLPNPRIFSRGFFQPIVSDKLLRRVKGKLQNMFYYKRMSEEDYQSALAELSSPPWSNTIIPFEAVDSAVEDEEVPTIEEPATEEVMPVEPIDQEETSP